MTLRIFILTLMALIVIRAIRNRLRRAINGRTQNATTDLGVDPQAIRDAEFTDLADTEETRQ